MEISFGLDVQNDPLAMQKRMMMPKALTLSNEMFWQQELSWKAKSDVSEDQPDQIHFQPETLLLLRVLFSPLKPSPKGLSFAV